MGTWQRQHKQVIGISMSYKLVYKSARFIDVTHQLSMTGGKVDSVDISFNIQRTIQ